MRWNQIRASWPDREIRLFGAGVDSGTYDYFTEAMVGKEGASRGDFTSSEDDNVIVQGVSSDELALGFLPLAYVEAEPARAEDRAGRRRQGGQRRGPDRALGRDGAQRHLSAAFASALHLRVAQGGRSARSEQFVEMFFSRTDLVQEVGYIELTPEIYELARKHFADRKVGTVFGEGGPRSA